MAGSLAVGRAAAAVGSKLSDPLLLLWEEIWSALEEGESGGVVVIVADNVVRDGVGGVAQVDHSHAGGQLGGSWCCCHWWWCSCRGRGGRSRRFWLRGRSAKETCNSKDKALLQIDLKMTQPIDKVDFNGRFFMC